MGSLSRFSNAHPLDTIRKDQGEDRAANQDVVEMRNDKVGVLLLGIDGRGAVHDAGKAADSEKANEAECVEHRRAERYRALEQRCSPIEDFDC